MLNRQIMLQRRIAVLNERNVHGVERTALGNHFHVFRLGCSNDHLTLIAARLVVIFDAVRALCLQSSYVFKGVLIGIDFGVDVWRLGAIDDFARRKDPRRDDLACPLHLRCNEYLGSAGRRIVDRCRAHCEVDH